jgi:hypothetical protein
MKRILLLISAVSLALALAPAASARVVELGAVPNSNAKPACPADPCEAAVRVTGLQGRAAGGPKNPYYIRRDGYIVAFTVQLSQPTPEQVAYFNDNFGSPAQVRLSVLRRGETRKTRLNYRLVSQTDMYEVDDYFGSAPTFVLNRPLRVRKTNWIAMTVPTWAPMFANNLTRSDWWRASRAKNSCETPRSLNQFAVQDLRDISVFGCTYHGARLLYTATYVPDPRPTVRAEDDQDR